MMTDPANYLAFPTCLEFQSPLNESYYSQNVRCLYVKDYRFTDVDAVEWHFISLLATLISTSSTISRLETD